MFDEGISNNFPKTKLSAEDKAFSDALLKGFISWPVLVGLVGATMMSFFIMSGLTVPFFTWEMFSSLADWYAFWNRVTMFLISFFVPLFFITFLIVLTMFNIKTKFNLWKKERKLV